MRTLWLAFIMITLISLPATGHALGLMKYFWDGVSNQLGLDRGPIMKSAPKCRPQFGKSYQRRIPRHVYFPTINMQAGGF
jgi:hypothetical protein